MAQAVRGGDAQGRAVLSAADTIAAVSSGRPPAAIAVIRISGPAAIVAATAIAGPLPPSRQAGLRALRGDDGNLLDRALVLVFPGPASATGEDLVEFHCHGGRAVVEAVEQTLYTHPDIRRAEPGEFTRRALLNGCIDLIAAEGLADLLEAETETQRRAALSAVEGRVSQAIRGWMDRLAVLSAQVEASIDYAEDGDVEAEASSLAAVTVAQRSLAQDMAAVLSVPPVDRWRDGVRVVIAGPPNAGKSTLVNLLGGREAAIVSPTAGTTRDRIEVTVRRNGIGYVLVDTAGLRDHSVDPIELIGMDKARDAAMAADLIIWLGDEPAELEGLVVKLHARTDITGRERLPSDAVLAISSSDPASIERVWDLIEFHARSLYIPDRVPFREREWRDCREALAAIETIQSDALLSGEQLRRGRSCLANALGLDATEAMMDSLFSRFCLGK